MADANALGDSPVFTEGAFVLPNEDHFYLFDNSLASKTDVMISVGTFRTLENASRGNFSHVVMMDMDLGIVRFNHFQIDVLRRSPTRREFILNFLGFRSLFETIPQLEEWLQAAEFKKMADFLNTKNFEEIFTGDSEEKKMRYSYLLRILNLSDFSRETKAGFLISEERYGRLHKLALLRTIVSVRGDLADASFARLGHVLREYDLRVSVLDVSNSPDYFLHMEGNAIDAYRLNLQQIPFTRDAEVLFTTGMMFGPHKMGLWHYVSFAAQDYIYELGKLIRLGSYSWFVNSPAARDRALSPTPSTLVCHALFSVRSQSH